MEILNKFQTVNYNSENNNNNICIDDENPLDSHFKDDQLDFRFKALNNPSLEESKKNSPKNYHFNKSHFEKPEIRQISSPSNNKRFRASTNL